MWYEKIQQNSLLRFFSFNAVELEDLGKFLVNAHENEIVAQQGSSMDFLIIPITTAFSLELQNESVTQKFGDLTAGRSLNLYSYLRKTSHKYSCRAKIAGQYLKVPRAKFDEVLERHPEVKTYLFKVTEESVLLGIAKEWRAAGVSDSIILPIINRMQCREVPPQTAISNLGEVSKILIYLYEGKYLVHDSKKNLKTWIMPLKSWHFVEQCLNGAPNVYALTALDKSRYYFIDSKVLLSLKTNFETEFEVLKMYLTVGNHSPAVEEENLELEIEDLFQGSAEQKRLRFSYPIVRQNDEMDCAPACLSMVSEFFGRDLSLQFWRSRLSTNREGTSLFDLAVTTEKNGLISHCLLIDKIEEVDPFLFPFIILRKYHYMVVYKVKKTTVIVGDPAFGIREIPITEIEDGLEKVALFLKPNSDFYLHETSASPWTHYLALFRGLEKEFSMAFLCSLLGVVFSIVPAFISQFALDEVLAQKDLGMLWIILGICVGVTLVTNLTSYAKNYYFVYIINKFNFRSASVFTQKMFSLPYTFFSSRHVGDFTQRISEIQQLRNFVTNTLFSVSMNLISLVLYAGVLLALNVQIGLFALASIPLMLVIPLLFSRRLDRSYQEIFTKSSEQSSYITDLIEGISVIKNSGAEVAARIRFENKLVELIKSQNKFSMTAIGVDSASQTYLQGTQFLILGISIFLGIQGNLSAGHVISISLICNQMFAPLQSIASEWDQFIRLKSILSRLNDVFLAPSETSITKISSQARQSALRGEIEFRNVWFRYGGEGSEWTLKNLNFKVEQGQKIAIVGPSGSGKSTIAGLLSRLYEPTEGQIFIDGRDYREYDLNWLRCEIGLLQQDNRLFHGSLYENVAISELDANEENLVAAAENASATELIEKKSFGWHHHVPHGGVGFSGGEKQKIALMRLFYKNPSVIILDEATSALDGISEREVIKNVEKLMQGKTIINIAHRYSTVKYSDFALVLHEGRVVGFGSIEHLSTTHSIFKSLFGISEVSFGDSEKDFARKVG